MKPDNTIKAREEIAKLRVSLLKLKRVEGLPHLVEVPQIQCDSCFYQQRVFTGPDKVLRLIEVHTGTCKYFERNGKEHEVTLQPQQT
jgi:hypothetical protein